MLSVQSHAWHWEGIQYSLTGFHFSYGYILAGIFTCHGSQPVTHETYGGEGFLLCLLGCLGSNSSSEIV